MDHRSRHRRRAGRCLLGLDLGIRIHQTFFETIWSKIFNLRFLGSVFLSDLIRKPGIALFASIVAAFVESIITQWGMSAVIYGVIQGLGAELVFAVFAYKNWSLTTLSLAAAVSAFFSYTYDYLTNEYANLATSLNLLQVTSFMISAVVLGAFLSRYLANRLLKTGLLDNFLIAKNRSE